MILFRSEKYVAPYEAPARSTRSIGEETEMNEDTPKYTPTLPHYYTHRNIVAWPLTRHKPQQNECVPLYTIFHIFNI